MQTRKAELWNDDRWGDVSQHAPDRCYRRAKGLVDRGSDPGRNDSPEVRSVWRYILRILRGTRLKGKCKPEDIAVDAAFRLHDSPFARQLIRGLVLAGTPVDDIAALMSLPRDVITTYETVFWHVRPMLQAQGAVGVMIESSAHDDQERESLQVAYAHGKDAFLQVMGIAKMEAETLALLQQRTESRLLLQAVVASCLPVQSEEAAKRVMRDCFKMLDLKAKDATRQAMDKIWRAKIGRHLADLRVQKSQVRAQQVYLREKANRVVAYEKGLAEREKEWAKLVAAAQQTLREPAEPRIAAPNLAALRESAPARPARRAASRVPTRRKAG